MPLPSKGAYSKSEHQKASKAAAVDSLAERDRALLEQYGAHSHGGSNGKADLAAAEVIALNCAVHHIRCINSCMVPLL